VRLEAALARYSQARDAERLAERNLQEFEAKFSKISRSHSH
jgi:exonuclease VII small subunit